MYPADTQVSLATRLASQSVDALAEVGYLPTNFHQYRACVAKMYLAFLIQPEWVVSRFYFHGLSGGWVAEHGDEDASGETDIEPFDIPLHLRAHCLEQAVSQLPTLTKIWFTWRHHSAQDWQNAQAEHFTNNVMKSAPDFALWMLREAEASAYLWESTCEHVDEQLKGSANTKDFSWIGEIDSKSEDEAEKDKEEETTADAEESVEDENG